MASSMKRREVVAWMFASGTGLVSGCLNNGGDNDTNYATLQRLYFINTHEDTTTVKFKIENMENSEVVQNKEYELPPGGDEFDGIPVDCVWPDSPLTLLIKPTGGEKWSTFQTTDHDGCLSMLVEINPDGVSYFGNNNCSDRLEYCHTD